MRTHLSLSIRTRERYRLRISQSSPTSESTSPSTVMEQLPSTPVNMVMEENNANNKSVIQEESTSVHDIMCSPLNLDDSMHYKNIQKKN